MASFDKVVLTDPQKAEQLAPDAISAANEANPLVAVMRLAKSLVVWMALGMSHAAAAGQYADAVAALSFSELELTFDVAKVNKVLGDKVAEVAKQDRQAAALLVSMGALPAELLSDPVAAKQAIDRFVAVVNSRHPALMGRVGDASVLHHMAGVFQYDDLLKENAFLERLGKALASGVLTGYDLRMKGVYDNFPAGHTFVYSQSNLVHLQQLVTLMASEDIGGWVYLTPKVSAFLYREDWGPASDAVKTLEGGVRVIQGREVAAMFQFDTADDRLRFHQMMLRFAKRDTEEEQGLIASSWWQPFYYSDQPLEGFMPISLLVISSERHEATLTILEEKTPAVVKALADLPFPSRVDKVWVNPAFYRFLNGDYK